MSKPQGRGKSARTHSYQIVDFKAPSSLEHHTEQDCTYPLGAAAALVVQERCY